MGVFLDSAQKILYAAFLADARLLAKVSAANITDIHVGGRVGPYILFGSQEFELKSVHCAPNREFSQTVQGNISVEIWTTTNSKNASGRIGKQLVQIILQNILDIVSSQTFVDRRVTEGFSVFEPTTVRIENAIEENMAFGEISFAFRGNLAVDTR